MIVVIVTNIEREVTVDSFQRAGTVETTRATRPDAPFDGVLRQVLHHMPCAAARQLGFVVPTRFPHSRDMMQPEVSCFDIDCALPDVMLNIRVCHFVL